MDITSFAGKQMVVASDDDTIANLLRPHDEFLSSTQSHLAKLQVRKKTVIYENQRLFFLFSIIL